MMVVCIGWVIILSFAVTADAIEYEMIDIGTLGGNESFGFGLNGLAIIG